MRGEKMSNNFENLIKSALFEVICSGQEIYKYVYWEGLREIIQIKAKINVYISLFTHMINTYVLIECNIYISLTCISIYNNHG